MKFIYEYSNPDQLVKVTFPYPGKITFYLIGGGGGRGGNDASGQGAAGQHGAYFSGEFRIAANTALVLTAGGGGKRGISGAAGYGGGAGGESLIASGGIGGNAGGGGSSGAGGGGGAASFIMTQATYDSLVAAISANSVNSLDWPHFTAGGGGGGGGSGLYSGGRTSIPADVGTTLVRNVDNVQKINGAPGVNKGGDGGGGGGGGGGWSRSFEGVIIGGGLGGSTVGGDAGAFSGSAGASYITDKIGGGISHIKIFHRYTERNSGSIRALNQPLWQLPYDNKGIGGGNTNSQSWDGGDGFVRLEYEPDNQDTSDIYTKRNSSFGKVPEIYIRANNNNIWQQVKDVYVKNNGSWVNVFHVVPDEEYVPSLENLNTVIRGPQNKGSDVGWVGAQWGTWYFGYYPLLWDYGIAKTSIWTLGQNEFTTTVFIPTAGNYRMFVASDNSGYCTINCKRGTSVDSFNTWPGYKEYIVNLPKGEVYLTAGYTNTGGPGAIAVLLTHMSGSRVWDTRSWVAGTYRFKYNTIDASLIGTPVCGTITDLTPEAPPPEPPPYDGGGGG